MSTVVTAADTAAIPARPPAWFVAATGLLALTILVLAVAETDLRAHYLIDNGEFLSVFGVVFVLGAGLVLYRQRRLAASMPLVLPWLLYPVITQGDQIIDNLSINSMRIICHVLLAAIFGTPVAVIVMAARGMLAPRPGSRRTVGGLLGWIPGVRALAEGRRREGVTYLSVALMTLEMWLADQYLGTLMIVTMIVVILGVLAWGSLPDRPQERTFRNERIALWALTAGVVLSLGVYLGYKNAPGAYQGSPSFFMDPAKQNLQYRLDRVAVPPGAARAPQAPEQAREALVAYGRMFEQLLAGYHILDRNYTYDYHNELFIRNTPLIPNYRAAGLAKVAEARAMWMAAEPLMAAARASVQDDDPLAGLLDDVRAFGAFCFDRAPVAEEMTAGFEKTKAGLQHAAHLYEGESKYLGTVLNDIMQKHQRATDAPELSSVTTEFVRISRGIYEAYAHHVVGF
ncbi:MAG: hypothetical protein JSU08_09415 [Acidobacteria bacterium]|nr:hypothetical protein [Acidobacteriota bacterium]